MEVLYASLWSGGSFSDMGGGYATRYQKLGEYCKLVFGSMVYNLWGTRNEFKHSGQPNTEEQIIKKILWELRARIVEKGKFHKTRENLS
jgi:hypothetical protein